ncbi:glutaminase [Chryseobacterium sp. G0162]|uniref:glutaminase n=1 Tax=Chryseobacterium sp. G0162 TaxID=2487063 RepID=UPI001E496172|nr:glutaminase [Chryseobacterium sp. G0162]
MITKTYRLIHLQTRSISKVSHTKNADTAKIVEPQILSCGITVSVPGKMGIGVFSPALDQHGNSLAGYHIILDLAKQYNLSIF